MANTSPLNVFIIPSWYPSDSQPIAGLFIQDQIKILVENHPEINFGISLWGSNDDNLLIQKADGLKNLKKLLMGSKRDWTNSADPNQYFTPAFTWTRKFLRGNIKGILKANLRNLGEFSRKHGPPDLIHAYTAYPAGYIAYLISKDLDIPYIVTEQMSPFPFDSFLTGDTLISPAEEALESADRVISPSHSQSKGIIKYCPKSQIDVIPNFVDDKMFQVGPKSDNDEVRIFTLGRLETQKGFENFLLALSEVLPNSEKRITVFIGGDGSLREELIQLSGSLKLDIKWLGHLNRIEVLEEMQKCSFFCLPSLHESFGIVLIEALACGKPIVATKCGGPEDIVNNQNGLLAEVNNTKDLAAQISKMVNSYEGYVPQVIRGDFEKRFASRQVTPRIVALYGEVLDS